MPGLIQECKAELSEWSGAEDRAREWLQGEGRVSRVDGSVRMKKISTPFCLSRKLGCIVSERFLSQTLAACRALLKNAGLELRTSSQRQSHLPPTLLLRIRALLTHKVLFTPLAASLRQTDPPPTHCSSSQLFILVRVSLGHSLAHLTWLPASSNRRGSFPEHEAHVKASTYRLCNSGLMS